MSSLELLEEACRKLPGTHKKMFGGHGFFAPNGGMYAGIVTDDKIIFKLVGKEREDLIALGGAPWVYQGKHKPMTMKDWICVPEGFYDEPDELEKWAKVACRLAPSKSKSAPASRGPKKSRPAASSPKAKSPKRPARPKK